MKKILGVALVCALFARSAASDSSVEELSESNRILTGRVEVLEKKIDEMEGKLSALENTQSQRDKEEVAAKAAADLVAKKSPEEVVKMSKKLIEEGNFSEARALLNAFISKKSGNIYCGMMMYYIGKSFFLEKDYENAALEYMRSYKTNPNGSKSAAALYKLALCFKRLNEMDKYKSTLKKIIDEYPGEFSKKASLELKTAKNAL
ncbi:MAG: tetratricopeptide repeat protein [Holosporaceae bacterium]|nr:tetratricopeptide repeat protein [Holosporaceae bacterium]